MSANVLEQLTEAWQTNNRINLFLIDRISEEGMQATLSKRGGRNVARQFAHLHNNRVWHLEERGRPLSKGLYKFPTAEVPGKEKLKECLNDSAARFQSYMERWLAGEKGYRCFKKGMIQYLSYFIAHESHHRGNILLTLKQCGHGLDKQTQYAIWGWDNF